MSANRNDVNTSFKSVVVWIDKGIIPTSTDSKADALTTTPPRRFVMVPMFAFFESLKFLKERTLSFLPRVSPLTYSAVQRAQISTLSLQLLSPCSGSPKPKKPRFPKRRTTLFLPNSVNLAFLKAFKLKAVFNSRPISLRVEKRNF